MFDGIGKSLDPEIRRRRLQASVLAALLVGGALGTLTMRIAETVVQAPIPVQDDDLVMVQLDEIELDVEPPPPMAPKLGGGQQAQQGTPDVEPVPDTPPEARELEKFVDKPMVDAERRGEKDGTGDAETTVDAPPGPGQADGDPNGELLQGHRAVHRSDVHLRRQIIPDYPADATAEATCRVRVDIGATGFAKALKITGCDDLYAAETRRAVEKWKWSKRDAGLRTVYRIVFKAP